MGAWGRDRSPVDAARRGRHPVHRHARTTWWPRWPPRCAPCPPPSCVHLSGSLGLDVLAGHPRRGSLHPLVPLPTPAIGSERLRSGVTLTVAGDPVTRAVAEDLGGNVVEVADADRAAYHAAAVIAANHLVALMGQVERVAATAGLPLDAFAGLMRAASEDALALGPGAGADRARRPRRLGDGGAAPGRPSPACRPTAASSPATTPWWRWPDGSSLDTAVEFDVPSAEADGQLSFGAAVARRRAGGVSPATTATAPLVTGTLRRVRRPGWTRSAGPAAAVGVVLTMGALHDGHASLHPAGRRPSATWSPCRCS